MHYDHKRDYYGDEINILDYWRVLIRYRTLIACLAASALAASIIITIYLPEKYASTARIFSPRQDNSLGFRFLSQIPGGLDPVMFGGGTPADLWLGFLDSLNLRDAIVERFDLKDRYDVSTIEDARNALDGNVSINKSREGIIAISVVDRDPQHAADLANAFVEELDRINREVVTSSGRRMRIFVETRLVEARRKLAEAEEELKDFQVKHKAIKLDGQSEAIIEAAGSIKGKLMAKEVERKALLSFATPNNPHVEFLRAEIRALEQGLKELEEGNPKSDAKEGKKNLFIPASKIPDLGIQYARLLRDFKILETVYELLTQQYEMARVQEAKDSPTVQVLDKAQVPENRIKPRRVQVVALSVLISVFLSVLIALFLEYIRHLKLQEISRNDDP